MNLAHLSGDILAQIARCDGASAAILALWKCGDVAMSKKICAWVDKIDLEDRNRHPHLDILNSSPLCASFEFCV